MFFCKIGQIKKDTSSIIWSEYATKKQVSISDIVTSALRNPCASKECDRQTVGRTKDKVIPMNMWPFALLAPKKKIKYMHVQWWFVNPDTFVPCWYFRINEFSGLLNRLLVQKWKSFPTLLTGLARFPDYRSPDYRIITANSSSGMEQN